MNKIKSDHDWETSAQSGGPLLLIQVIEKCILSHTEDMYPFDSVYKQEKALYSFHQNNLTNYQWYENLNTKSYVANSIVLDRHHKIIMDHADQEYHRDAFENITEE